MDLQDIFDKFNLDPTPDNDATPLTTSRPSEHTDFDSDQQLLPFESQILQYMLDKAANELLILNQGFTQEADKSSFLLKSRKFADKFQDSGAAREKLRQTSNKMQSNPLDMLDIKIRNDINFARRILYDTCKNIKEDGNFIALHEAVANNAQYEQDEYNLIRDYVVNKKKHKMLKAKLKSEAMESELQIKALNDKIAMLDDQIHDLKVTNFEKLQLVEKWEKVRLEQQEIMIENEQILLSREYESIIDKINTEQRAIDDISNFIKYKIEDIDKSTGEWMERYEKEIEMLDDNIQLTSEQITDVKLKHAELKEIYELRENEIFDYWEQKRIAEEIYQLEQKKIRCAIQIQAWWRGTMVRNFLGPFKKKKGKGKGGKKKK